MTVGEQLRGQLLASHKRFDQLDAQIKELSVLVGRSRTAQEQFKASFGVLTVSVSDDLVRTRRELAAVSHDLTKVLSRFREIIKQEDLAVADRRLTSCVFEDLVSKDEFLRMLG